MVITRLFVFGAVLGVVVAQGRDITPVHERLKRQFAIEGDCLLPEPLQNGRYRPSYRRCPPGNNTPACRLVPGTSVPKNWVIHFTCNEGYNLSTNLTVAACAKGEWLPALPVCSRPSPRKSFTCTQNGVYHKYIPDEKDCNGYFFCMRNGTDFTKVQFKCPGATLFNPRVALCVSPKEVECTQLT